MRTVIPQKGRYKGRQMTLQGRIAGTVVYRADYAEHSVLPHTCYIHENELSPLERILIRSRQNWWRHLRTKAAVKWEFFLRDLAGAELFYALNEVGEEFLYAKRPRLARLLFRGVRVLGPGDPLPKGTV